MGIFDFIDRTAASVFGGAERMKLRHNFNCGAGAFIAIALAATAFRILPYPADLIAGYIAVATFAYAMVQLALGFHRT